jgi:DNA (cytosine-5)-methyltransferase 1
LKYLSVCSGIEAASVAWDPLGFEPVGFSEIEPFPSAVLQHRFPSVQNYGDMTTYKEWGIGQFDILVGGTPCQSFSIAGLRGGLDDPRGNLMLTYGAIADHYRPTWIVWENVPGVLSSNRGRDFGTFLGMLGKLGYGFAYRILDAQYYGVAQRRRRVFVVGHLGDWRRSAQVLFESESLCGHPAPSREARQDVTEIAGTLATSGGGTNRPAGNANELDFCVVDNVSKTKTTKCSGRYDIETESFVAFGYQCSASQGLSIGKISPTLDKSKVPACYKTKSNQLVRRLTPIECERLQGFPDDYTLIDYKGKPAADSPRYKALGNSMAVPVMRWIGERIKKYSEVGNG